MCFWIQDHNIAVIFRRICTLIFCRNDYIFNIFEPEARLTYHIYAAPWQETYVFLLNYNVQPGVLLRERIPLYRDSHTKLSIVLFHYAVSFYVYILTTIVEWNMIMQHWGNDTDGGNLKYWEKNYPIAIVSITNLVWIDVESNKGSRVHKHINTQYGKQTKRIKLEQVVHIVTILLWRMVFRCRIFLSSAFYMKYWIKRTVLDFYYCAVHF